MKLNSLIPKGVTIKVMQLATTLQITVLFIFSINLVACSPATPEMQSIKGRTMGTGYSILWPAQAPSINTEVTREKIETLLGNINSQMSTYQPDSEISVFNSSNPPYSNVIVMISHEGWLYLLSQTETLMVILRLRWAH
jgi:thiamine biosynthesis lipoprotein ApbE